MASRVTVTVSKPGLLVLDCGCGWHWLTGTYATGSTCYDQLARAFWWAGQHLQVHRKDA